MICCFGLSCCVVVSLLKTKIKFPLLQPLQLLLLREHDFEFVVYAIGILFCFRMNSCKYPKHKQIATNSTKAVFSFVVLVLLTK